MKVFALLFAFVVISLQATEPAREVQMGRLLDVDTIVSAADLSPEKLTIIAQSFVDQCAEKRLYLCRLSMSTESQPLSWMHGRPWMFPTYDGASTWEHHDLPPGVPVAQVLKLGDASAYFLRSAKGLSYHQIGGRSSPAQLQIGHSIFEMIAFIPKRSKAVPKDQIESLDIYVRSEEPQLSTQSLTAVTRRLLAGTGIPNLFVFARRDRWFLINECPVFLPFLPDEPFPSRLQFEMGREIVCVATKGRPIGCGPGKEPKSEDFRSPRADSHEGTPILHRAS